MMMDRFTPFAIKFALNRRKLNYMESVNTSREQVDKALSTGDVGIYWLRHWYINQREQSKLFKFAFRIYQLTFLRRQHSTRSRPSNFTLIENFMLSSSSLIHFFFSLATLPVSLLNLTWSPTYMNFTFVCLHSSRYIFDIGLHASVYLSHGNSSWINNW